MIELLASIKDLLFWIGLAIGITSCLIAIFFVIKTIIVTPIKKILEQNKCLCECLSKLPKKKNKFKDPNYFYKQCANCGKIHVFASYKI